ncbi:MAG TPA: hypothetical protein VK052_06645 [Zeimonas sp.]|jgi:hypothetical protein|nr:hypothetical protein [Zeimonas sp.]
MTELKPGDRIQIEWPARHRRGYVWDVALPRGPERPRVWHNGQEITEEVTGTRVGERDATVRTKQQTIRVQGAGECQPGMFDGTITEARARETEDAA